MQYHFVVVFKLFLKLSNNCKIFNVCPFFSDILQVSVPQDIYNVNYGQTIQLVCTVTGSPAATEVYWVRVRQGQSTEIKASTMDTNKYSGVTLNNPSLTVLNANENDGGVYKCYAKNIVGVGQSQQTQLNVIGSKYKEISPFLYFLILLTKWFIGK